MSWWSSMVSVISGVNAADEEPPPPINNPLSPPHPHAHMPTSVSSPNEFRASSPSSSATRASLSSDSSVSASRSFWSIGNSLAATSSSLAEVYKVKCLVADTAFAAGSVIGSASIELADILSTEIAPGYDHIVSDKLEKLHKEGDLFLVEGSGDDWAAWRLEFAELWSSTSASSPNFLHRHCATLIESSHSLSAALSEYVPMHVSEETFWCRYLYARHRIIPQEHALFVLEINVASFTVEPIETDFQSWKDMFVSKWQLQDDDISSDCALALQKSQLLSWQYDRLVPVEVSAQDFWCRYLFRRAGPHQHTSITETPQVSRTSPSPARNNSASHHHASPDLNVRCAASDSQVNNSGACECSLSSSRAAPSTPPDARISSDSAVAIEWHGSDNNSSPKSPADSPSRSQLAACIPNPSLASAQDAAAPSDAAGWDEWE